MYIILGIFVLVFVGMLAHFKWNPIEDGTWIAHIVVATLVGAVAGGAVGSFVLGGVRAHYEQEVDVYYSIYEGPSGRYVEAGTSGEYNDQITMWYWKDGSSLRKAWRSADSVGINYLPEDERPYAHLTCPSGETLPEWVKLPWEKGDHDWKAECDYEFVNLYVPQGES